MAQLVGASSLQDVARLILDQDTCLGCRFIPAWGKATIDVSFSLPSALSKINKNISSGDDLKKNGEDLNLLTGKERIYSRVLGKEHGGKKEHTW